MSFTFIDLFAGIGGLRLAFESQGGQCVFTSEFEQHCVDTYKANFGGEVYGDITKINENDVPNHDILIAGFPCQAFSISGKMKGFNDTRGTLFFDIMRIVNLRNPQLILLENVKHLIHHDKKRTLSTIIQLLEDHEYFVSYKVLNAKDFGLAQNRERIVIVASKKKEFDFNQLKISKKSVFIKDILDKDNNFEILNKDDYTILEKEQWKTQSSGLIFCGYRNKKIREIGVRPNTEHLSRVHKQPNRIYHIDGTHPTIPSQEPSGRFWIYDNHKVRKLTLNECWKLMGFPANFKKLGSSQQQYKQIGNSVAVPMFKEIAKELVKQYFTYESSNHKSQTQLKLLN